MTDKPDDFRLVAANTAGSDEPHTKIHRLVPRPEQDPRRSTSLGSAIRSCSDQSTRLARPDGA
jgi:hypothetical protein